ncbi:hypothetical protein BCR44DRAFT_1428888 [Catenaria anguillulae PL171]|uniref:Uncharacterized protein n=1 Tax=Catenaria anguillulae PL171 TaxID=765915 RepID=A0A1Y2HYI4_9FUNG|nr:hypothetical protein BCR44DRAFT_1428888 [Catenaria anguillulae PL171]
MSFAGSSSAGCSLPLSLSLSSSLVFRFPRLLSTDRPFVLCSPARSTVIPFNSSRRYSLFPALSRPCRVIHLFWPCSQSHALALGAGCLAKHAVRTVRLCCWALRCGNWVGHSHPFVMTLGFLASLR